MTAEETHQDEGASFADQATKAQAVEQMEARVDGRVDRLVRTLEPVIAGAEKLAHSIIWLSAGALVLSVTVTQVLLDSAAGLSWTWLLPTSWVLFGLAVVLALWQMGTYLRIRSGPFRFERKKPELRSYVDEVWGEEDAAEQIEKKIVELADNAWENPLDAIRRHDVAAGFSALSFVLALAALLTFAIVNLP